MKGFLDYLKEGFKKGLFKPDPIEKVWEDFLTPPPVEDQPTKNVNNIMIIFNGGPLTGNSHTLY